MSSIPKGTALCLGGFFCVSSLTICLFSEIRQVPVDLSMDAEFEHINVSFSRSSF